VRTKDKTHGKIIDTISGHGKIMNFLNLTLKDMKEENQDNYLCKVR
jgi:hypothetical protein